jgi:DNA-binding transcriptional ArsR family regulator
LLKSFGDWVVQQRAREIPLSEITLRKYEQPHGLSERELVRKLCLSVGLLQPGDSRDVVVDVALVLFTADKPLTAREIESAVIDSRERARAPILGVAPSNIRRQILRMRELFLIEKVSNSYRVKENQRLATIFDEHIERYYLAAITKRVREYLHAVDEHFLARKQTATASTTTAAASAPTPAPNTQGSDQPAAQ